MRWARCAERPPPPARALQAASTRHSSLSFPVVPHRSLRLPLPRALVVALTTLAALIALLVWWQRQLPARLAEAAARGQLDACLHYADQLQVLAWLPGSPAPEQGRCRREKAAELWAQQRWAEALGQQRQLRTSAAAQPADRQRWQEWQAALRRTAMERFRAGDLEGALAALAPLGEAHSGNDQAFGDQLRQAWERNRLEAGRAATLVAQARWWEALDSLNRLDHPWWQRRVKPLHQQVNRALEQLKGQEREHDGHGSVPHTVPQAQLEAEVDRRIAAGMDEWKAFQAGCQALGGQVVELGPETVCRR